MSISPQLLEILACPKCKGALAPAAQGEGLACAACGVVYPIREDIPIMLVEEAVELSKWEAGERQAKP
ncbi:MAG: Trm112 family protein [Acidobacteriota bacterium]